MYAKKLLKIFTVSRKTVEDRLNSHLKMFVWLKFLQSTQFVVFDNAQLLSNNTSYFNKFSIKREKYTVDVA